MKFDLRQERAPHQIVLAWVSTTVSTSESVALTAGKSPNNSAFLFGRLRQALLNAFCFGQVFLDCWQQLTGDRVYL